MTKMAVLPNQPKDYFSKSYTILTVFENLVNQTDGWSSALKGIKKSAILGINKTVDKVLVLNYTLD